MHPVRKKGAMACALFLTCAAAPPSHAHQAHIYRDSLFGDHHTRWTIRSLLHTAGTDATTRASLRPDDAWLAEYQDDPASIYSGLSSSLTQAALVYTPRGAMAAAPDAGAGTMNPVGAFPATAPVNRMLAWNLGLHKALPSDQFRYDAIQPELKGADIDANARSNLLKAGVYPTVLAQAQRLSGPSLSTLGAELAIAVSTLMEWRRVAAGRANDLGIRLDVIDRFKAATSLADMTEQDLSYLADILRLELSIWRGGTPGVFFNLSLPAPMRIARAAAAHHGSRAGYAACSADGTRNPLTAGTSPDDLAHPICFTDATDRSVYRWYRAMRASELAQTPQAFADFDQASRLIAHFSDVRGSWAGAYAEEALEWSNHAEILDAQMIATQADPALGIDEQAFLRLVDRASHLVCRSGAP